MLFIPDLQWVVRSTGVLSDRKKHGYPSQNALRNTLACFLAGKGTPLTIQTANPWHLPPYKGVFLRIIILNFHELTSGLKIKKTVVMKRLKMFLLLAVPLVAASCSVDERSAPGEDMPFRPVRVHSRHILFTAPFWTGAAPRRR